MKLKTLSKKAQRTLIGNFSDTSKMPGLSWGISAHKCKVGGRMAKVKGSTCYDCYALKNFYEMDNVQQSLENKWQALFQPDFVENFVTAFQLEPTEKREVFRFLDSGDLQNIIMLRIFCRIAARLPDTLFWLPTREWGIVRGFIKSGGIIPENLNIRLSELMVDETEPKKAKLATLAKSLGCTVSGVSKLNSFNCPASKQDNECGSCRSCWDKSEFRQVYKKH